MRWLQAESSRDRAYVILSREDAEGSRTRTVLRVVGSLLRSHDVIAALDRELHGRTPPRISMARAATNESRLRW